jgi:hypothetical protein
MLLEKFLKPSGVSEDERMKRAAAIIGARGIEWPDRSSHRQVSERNLHRPRPRHQPTGTRLGSDAHRLAERAF